MDAARVGCFVAVLRAKRGWDAETIGEAALRRIILRFASFSDEVRGRDENVGGMSRIGLVQHVFSFHRGRGANLAFLRTKPRMMMDRPSLAVAFKGVGGGPSGVEWGCLSPSLRPLIPPFSPSIFFPLPIFFPARILLEAAVSVQESGYCVHGSILNTFIFALLSC